MLVAHFGVPLAGGVLLALNTRLSPMEIGYILDHAQAHVLVVDSGFLPIVPAALRDAPAVERVVVLEDDQAGVEFPQSAWDALGDKAMRYAGLRGGGVGRAAAVGGRGRDGADHAQLHLGDHGQAEGRRLPPPRRVPEQLRRDHPLRVHVVERLPVDAADVPLQRLVYAVGRDRRRRHARLSARGARRRDLGAAGRTRDHAPQRRADP
jgi:hypothetical protein